MAFLARGGCQLCGEANLIQTDGANLLAALIERTAIVVDLLRRAAIVVQVTGSGLCRSLTWVDI